MYYSRLQVQIFGANTFFRLQTDRLTNNNIMKSD